MRLQGRFGVVIAMALVAGTAACGEILDPDPDPEPTEEEINETRVTDGYVVIVRASYADSLATAQALRFAIDAFIATRNATTLAMAREAWKARASRMARPRRIASTAGRSIDRPTTANAGSMRGPSMRGISTTSPVSPAMASTTTRQRFQRSRSR